MSNSSNATKVGLGTKLKTGVQSFFKHWNHPKEGKYVGNKEVLAYSVGGMGLQFVGAITAQVVLNSNCILLGSVYGMTPMALTILLTVNTIFTLLIQPLKSYWIDNIGAKSKKQRGKSRPFLLIMSIPTAIVLPLIPFVPPALAHQYPTLFACIIGVLFIIMNFTYQFWLGMYNQLAQLISPDSTERADIVAVSSIIYSLAPTITGFIFPLLSNLFDDKLLDINFYRMIFPIFTVLGFALSLVAYFGTKERIVVPKSYKAKVKFKDGMKAIGKNKYFWIVTIPAWFFFARNAVTTSMNWAYIYILQDVNVQSVATLIIGTASGIGMATAPLIIRWVGSKWTVIISNMLYTISSIFLIIPGVNNSFWPFALFSYLSFFGGAVQIITGPAMHADALDYQQYKTGDRLEGFAGNFNIITQAIALGTNFIIPAIYAFFGLSDNYDVLFDTTIRTPIIQVLAILAAIGGIVCSIPYLWWDMDKKKHAEIIEILKQRAIEQNKAEGFENASFLSSDETLEDLYQDEQTVDEYGNKIVKEETTLAEEVKEDTPKDEEVKEGESADEVEAKADEKVDEDVKEDTKVEDHVEDEKVDDVVDNDMKDEVPDKKDGE